MGSKNWKEICRDFVGDTVLTAEVLHQLIGSLFHYQQGFIHLRWLAGFLNHQQ